MDHTEDVDDFCARHAAEFEEWTAEEAARQLTSVWILGLLLTLASAWAWHRSGRVDAAALSYLPAIVALVATSVWHGTRPARARPFAVDHYGFCTGLLSLGMAHSVAVMASTGRVAVNAPIQFVVFLTCMLAPGATLRANAYLAGVQALVVALVLGVCVGPAFLAQSAIQFIVGLGAGLFVNRHLTRARQYRFQGVHSHARGRAHALAELSKMVHPHVVAHIHDGGGLESSMPLGKADACVLAFDIMDSTSTGHGEPGFPAAVEAVIARCHSIMMEGYSMDPLVAKAFRLKDLGDGFLATVGFPLGVPGGRDPRVLAVELASRFVEVFDAEMARLEGAAEAHCCVGIAYGGVEGYFPKSGVKQYELRGQAITLATRYEALRRCILPTTGRRGNIVILREDVHAALDPAWRARFTEWDTRLPGQAVRDDPGAARAWYRFEGGSARSVTPRVA